jgi:hypothetical protein
MIPQHPHPQHSTAHNPKNEFTRYKGYKYTVTTGSVTAAVLQQPGNLKYLLGIAVIGTGAPTLDLTTGYGTLFDPQNNIATVNFTVNSDNLLENFPLGMLVPYNRPADKPFFPINRELHATDSITFTCQGIGANEPIVIALYFDTNIHAK